MRRLAFALASCLAGFPALAQTPIPIHLKAEVRERYDNPELPLFTNEVSNVDPLHAALAFFWSRIRLGVLSDPLPRFSAYAEIQDDRYWGEEGGTRSNIKGVDLHQGWLHLGDAEKFVRFGRQEYGLGEERLFGRDDWYEVGRTFDMVRLRSPLSNGRFVGEFLYAEVTNPVPDNADEAFELVALTRLLPRNGFLRLYAVEKHDSRRGPKTGNKLYIVTYGGEAHLFLGDWELDLESAGQAGENFDDNQRAMFAAGYVRRHLTLSGHRATLGLEFSRGSGDGNPDDGTSNHLDVLYPTRHDRYGFLDLLSLQNNRQVGLVLDASGERDGDVLHFAVRYLGVDDARGPWINARLETIGRDPTGSSGRGLGYELDLGLRRRIFREIDLTVALEGGYFHGDALARKIDHIVQAYEGAITLTYRFGL